MKLNKKIPAFLLGAIAAFCGISCLVTGMRFEGISIFKVALVCLVSAGITTALADSKWFWAIPGGFLLLLLRLWRKGSLELSLESFLYQISSLYDLGYGTGIIRWSEKLPKNETALLFFCLLGALVALIFCRSLLKRKGVLIPLLVTVLPVIPTMALTDTLPTSGYLFGTLTIVVLLLLNSRKNTTLWKLLPIPVAAALLALFLCLPQKDYVNLKWLDSILINIESYFTEDPQQGNSGVSTGILREEGDWVNLTIVGPKNHRRGVVLEVNANKSGYLYLRGKAFDTYYGTWWDCVATAPQVTAPASHNTRTVRISTRAMMDVLYLPYGAYALGYSGNSAIPKEIKGQVENEGPWRSYNVRYRLQPTADASWQQPSIDAPGEYTQLTAYARKEAEQYLAEHLPELSTMGVWDQANAIVDHVAASAQYSLNTPKMPEGTKDFAMWFLTESDSGYCVHFATAAAVLLRAANIPCRYASGYLVYTENNKTVEVENQNAHAWVEMFIDSVGWVTLEPTPSGGIEQTAPAPTEETTVPTESSTDTIPSGIDDLTLPTLPDVTAPSTEESTEATTAPTTEATTKPTVETTQDTSPPDRLPENRPNKDNVSDIGGANKPGAKDISWLKWVFYPLIFILFVLCQWRIRIGLRKRKRTRGKKSAQTLALWQEIELHCRILREEPEQELLRIAQKARFSQHAITREERDKLENWLELSTIHLRFSSLWTRLLATLIYALY